MNKPQLLKTTPEGGTIYSYQLTGGHTIFNRYLACYDGVCKFHTDFELAETSLQKMT